MSSDQLKYFVWVMGLKGPEPQIWSYKDMTSDMKPVSFLYQRELTPLEGNLGLDELKNRYPYVLSSNEAKS